TATGLSAQVEVTNGFEARRVLPGGPASRGAVNITQSQSVSVTSGGSAAARSGAACDGVACGVSSLTATAARMREAISGAADARGLVANNTVTTDAKASVSVAGRNLAPIRLIIDALTSIQNWGSARALSGEAVSAGGEQAATASQFTKAA